MAAKAGGEEEMTIPADLQHLCTQEMRFVVQGNYNDGQGWQDLMNAETEAAAEELLASHRASPHGDYRIERKLVTMPPAVPEWTAPSKLRAAFSAGEKAQKASDYAAKAQALIDEGKAHLATSLLDWAVDCYDSSASECDRAEWSDRAAEMRTEADKCRSSLADITQPATDKTLDLFRN